MVHQGTLDASGGILGSGSGLSTRSKTMNNPMDARERAARDFFAQKNLLPSADQPVKRADIYQAIIGATKLPKKDLAEQLIKTIEHTVIILRRMDEDDAQNEIITAINTNISTALENMNSEVNLGNQFTQFRNDMAKEMDSMMEKMQKITDDKLSIILASPKTRSFADVAATPPTTTNLPPSLNRQRIRAHVEIKKRQVLILNEGGEKGKELSEKSDEEVLNLLNEMIGRIEGNEGKRFNTVSKLRNSNHLLTEMSTPEAANWLRRIDNSLNFALEMDDAIKIAACDSKIIIHFVPTSFDPSSDFELRKLEDDNELQSCSITKARWAKAVQNRRENQKVASLLLYLSEPNAANKLISTGAVIANKRVRASKTIREELRCYHCQLYGHIANRCPRLSANPNDPPTCGRCVESHPTKDCNAERVRCANCNLDGHASNDRSCPEFAKKCEALNKCSLTNLLPFFPTDDDWTWLDKPNNAPRWNPAPRVTIRNPGSKPRQTQINDWMQFNPSAANRTHLGEAPRWSSQDPANHRAPLSPFPVNDNNADSSHNELSDH